MITANTANEIAKSNPQIRYALKVFETRVMFRAEEGENSAFFDESIFSKTKSKEWKLLATELRNRGFTVAAKGGFIIPRYTMVYW